MDALRKPFQGIGNILRFNRHLYLMSVGLIFFLFLISHILSDPYLTLVYVLQNLIVVTTLISLVVSFYIYDLSGLYKFDWMNELSIVSGTRIININAGFDETSALLSLKFPSADLTVYDFYNPLKHTEVSIKRARKAYLPFEGTLTISTQLLPLPDHYADYIFLIFSAHEIRDENERNVFFNELKRIIKPDGKIVLLEHLRDVTNFFAYNIGFFHFLPKSSWYDTFKHAELKVIKEAKLTPFINRFTLEKHGSPS